MTKQNPPRIDYTHPDVVRFIAYMAKQRFVSLTNIGKVFEEFNLPYPEWKANNSNTGWGFEHRLQKDGVLLLQNGYDWLTVMYIDGVGIPEWTKTVGWALNMRWYKKQDMGKG